MSLTCSRPGSDREAVKDLVWLLEGSLEFVTRLLGLSQREMQGKGSSKSW